MNNAIQNFKYSSSEAKSKPTTITAKEMSTQHVTLSQSGKKYAKQKHLGCKKERGQSEATLQTGRRDQKV